LWVGSATPGPVAVSETFTELIADPVRPFVYMHSGGTSLSVYNVHTGALVTTIANVASSLGTMAVASDGSTLFAVDRTASQVVPVNLATNTVGTAWSLASTSTDFMRLAYTRTDGVPVLAVADGAIHRASDGSVVLTFAQSSVLSLGTLVTASLGGTVFCAG